jgi:hypothetical protein
LALADLLKLADDTLHDLYNKVAPNPVKARAPFLKAIDKAVAQHGEGKQPRGAKAFWSANNGVAKITPNVGGRPIKIGGKDFVTVPAERFGDAMKSLRAAVEAGELDDALVADDGGTTPPHGRSPVRAPRKPRELGAAGPSRAWSDERRARFAHTIAARKAAKGA